MKNKIVFSIIIVLFGISCDLENDKIKDSKLLKYEMENRKLKRISEADIFNEAILKGDEIVKRVGDSIKTHLKTAIGKGGFTEAIKYCNVDAIPLTKKLSTQMYANIRRVSLKNRNPLNIPNFSEEKQLLEAYQYNFENQISSSSNIQILDSTILYTKPIFIEPLCLNCHGIENQEITPQNTQLLKELYPNGKATGFKDKDFRGMWSVVFNKKEFIKNM